MGESPVLCPPSMTTGHAVELVRRPRRVGRNRTLTATMLVPASSASRFTAHRARTGLVTNLSQPPRAPRSHRRIRRCERGARGGCERFVTRPVRALCAVRRDAEDAGTSIVAVRVRFRPTRRGRRTSSTACPVVIEGGHRPGDSPMSNPVMSNPVLLVYSHRPEVRERIITAIGRRPAPDVGRVDYLECTGVHEVIMAIDAQAADIVILDGEAQPTGGIGISRQIHQEAAVIPPIVLVVRRADDRWLATWAKADEVLVYPLDPVIAAETIAALLRRRGGEVIRSAADGTGAR